MSFQRAMSLDDLWSGEMAGVVVDGRRMLLVNLEGTVHAYADRCLHRDVPLSEGRLEGSVLVCRAHEWRYDARTGRGVNPENVCLAAYPVCVEAGEVLVDVHGSENQERRGP